MTGCFRLSGSRSPPKPTRSTPSTSRVDRGERNPTDYAFHLPVRPVVCRSGSRSPPMAPTPIATRWRRRWPPARGFADAVAAEGRLHVAARARAVGGPLRCDAWDVADYNAWTQSRARRRRGPHRADHLAGRCTTASASSTAHRAQRPRRPARRHGHVPRRPRSHPRLTRHSQVSALAVAGTGEEGHRPQMDLVGDRLDPGPLVGIESLDEAHHRRARGGHPGDIAAASDSPRRCSSRRAPTSSGESTGGRSPPRPPVAAGADRRRRRRSPRRTRRQRRPRRRVRQRTGGAVRRAEAQVLQPGGAAAATCSRSARDLFGRRLRRRRFELPPPGAAPARARCARSCRLPIIDEVTQPGKGTGLRHPHGARRLADHPADLVGAETADDSQLEQLLLVGPSRASAADLDRTLHEQDGRAARARGPARPAACHSTNRAPFRSRSSRTLRKMP